MRKTTRLAITCLAFWGLAVAPAMAMEVNINFLLGGKSLDEDDWGSESNSQGAFGVETTFGKPNWPVAVALDYLGSANAEEFRVTSPLLADIDLIQATFEFDFGVRKIWKKGKARPFVGGGFALIGAYQERHLVDLLTIDDSDGTLGLWFNGGAFWRLGKRFNIGIDVRLSAGKVQLFGRDVQAGGATVGMLLGWGWGGGE